MYSLLVLLAIASLAIAAPNPVAVPNPVAEPAPSATLTGNCVIDKCLDYSILSACPNLSDRQDLKCVCYTQVSDFFILYYYCGVAFSCSQSDTTDAISIASNACKRAGYSVDTDSILNGGGSGGISVPTPTFSSIPTSTSLSTNPFGQNGGISNPGGSSSGSDSTPSAGSSGSSGLATGAIIGIVVGCIVVLAIAAGLTVFFVKHHAKQKLHAQQAAAAAAAPQPAASGEYAGPPPPVSQFTSPVPGQGFFTPAPPYPSQQQPLMQDHYGQQIGQYGNGFFAPNDKPVGTTNAPPPTSTTPAPQELPAQNSPVPQGPYTQPRDNIYAEMPGDAQRK